MILDVEVTPEQLGAMLYRLKFPAGEFERLPVHVRDAYERDGVRLLQMLDPAWVP